MARVTLDVAAVCAAFRAGESKRDIARRLGVGFSLIRNRIMECIPADERRRITAVNRRLGGEKRSKTLIAANIESGHLQIEEKSDHLVVNVGGSAFLFDLSDRDLIESRAWSMASDKSGKQRLFRVASDAGKQANVFIYNEIMAPIPAGMLVDHINGDCTDNRRANLRFCTHSQNCQNRRPRKNKAVPYKGVARDKSSYRAHLHRPDGSVFSANFSTPEAAALAYDAEAKRSFGEFAWLNAHHFPELTRAREQDHV